MSKKLAFLFVFVQSLVFANNPVITLQGNNPMVLEVGTTYVDPGATAFDEPDGDLSSSIIISGSVNTSTVGTYIVEYSVTDSEGNTTTVHRAIEVIDTTPPVITLNGATTIYLELGSTYTELGATATDNYDGVITSSIIISGTVDTSNVGTYILLYNVSDSSGNTAETSRSVVVEANSPSLSIELTAMVTHIGDADIADRVVRADDIINYSTTVTNTGNVTLTDLVVVDALTDGAGNDLVMTSDPTNQWTIASLSPGESINYIQYYTIGSSAAFTGSISNVVTVTGDTPNGTGNITAISNSTVIETDLFASITITKQDELISDVDNEAGAGDLIEYTVVVENTGEVTVTDIELEDYLRSGDNTTIYLSSPNHNEGDLTPWPSFALAAGESSTLTGSYILSQEAVNTGSVSNFINATAKDPNGNDVVARSDDPDTSLVNDDTVTSIEQSASVIVMKTATITDSNEDGVAGVGDTIVYTITVENTGNVTLSSLLLTDTLTDLYDNDLALSSELVYYGSNMTQGMPTTLRVGEIAHFQASFIINQQAANAGGVSNIAAIIASTPYNIDNVSAESNNVITLIGCLAPLNPDAENQSVCEGSPITPIEYSFSNDVSGINLTWTKDGASIIGNPPGIGYSINTGQLVFEGNPSENITTTTTYSYNIQTTGGLCGSVNANGTIVVHPIPRIQLAATTVGSLSQIRCEGDDIDDIVINLLDGASSPGVTGLPAGLSYFYDSVANTLTISGTLDPSNSNDNYNYTVTASGSSGGCTASLSGVLTISREDVLTPMSEISQSVCEGNQITPISFNYSGGAIGVTLQWSVNGSVINLPSGLVVDNQEGNLTISGTLENFNSGDEISYSVTTNNSGCTPAKEYSGIITIVPTEQCIEPGKIILNGPVEVNDGTFYIKKEEGLILYSSFDDQCYRIKVHTGQVIAEPINCD